jgi:hypothetical protein
MMTASTRNERLRAYLAPLAGKPVVWGEDDCCLFAARWAEAEAGIALPLPRYAGEAEARALMAGGLEPLWRAIAARAGLAETGAPDHGDVGLIEVSAGPVGCIWLHGGRVALRHDSGWSYLRPRQFIAAWRVPAAI